MFSFIFIPLAFLILCIFCFAVGFTLKKGTVASISFHSLGALFLLITLVSGLLIAGFLFKLFI